MPRSLVNRLLTGLGLLLILSGLAVLGWVGWQMWGTTWQAQREQATVVRSLERDWAEGRESVTLDPQVSGGVDTQVGALLRIPRFGADYAVPVVEGTTDDVLTLGIGHFTDSAKPGAKGNFALAGHRITRGEPLRRMPELVPGDEVVVETRTKLYVYVLDTGGDDLRVDFSAGWVLGDVPTNPEPGGVQPAQEPGQRLITLTTCAELFHTDDRLIAFGHLDRVEKKDVAQAG